MILLIDTNIILDVVQKRWPHDGPASRVWEMVEKGSSQGFVSAITFNNMFYIARRQVGSPEATKVVNLLGEFFKSLPWMRRLFDKSISIAKADLVDAIQAAAAFAIGADYIVTRNTKGLQFPRVNGGHGGRTAGPHAALRCRCHWLSRFPLLPRLPRRN